jgi:hypothetical protein
MAHGVKLGKLRTSQEKNTVSARAGTVLEQFEGFLGKIPEVQVVYITQPISSAYNPNLGG